MPSSTEPDDRDALRRAAANRSIEVIESGMTVGLGTGRTALLALQAIAARIADGSLRGIVGVPTSRATEAAAGRLGVPLTAAEAVSAVDVTIDGADEVDPRLDLIKGAGGALLREKIVAQMSRRLVIVVDDGKLVARLGERAPLPLEVLPFGWRSHRSWLGSLGLAARLRVDEAGLPITTDQGNYLLDCDTGPIDAPAMLAGALDDRAGIVAHGLFLGLATDLVVGTPAGIVVRRRP